MTRKEEKQALRTTLRRMAEGLPQSYREKADAAITAHLLAMPAYQEAETVFCFVGTGWEIDTRPILTRALADGKRLCVLWYDSEDETKTSFHLPIYARLKIGLWGGYSSKWYIDGVGYYNAVKKTFLESDFSASAGLGVSWRHWDWRILYYKQDIAAKYTYKDYKVLGTSFSYYF